MAKLLTLSGLITNPHKYDKYINKIAKLGSAHPGKLSLDEIQYMGAANVGYRLDEIKKLKKVALENNEFEQYNSLDGESQEIYEMLFKEGIFEPKEMVKQ